MKTFRRTLAQLTPEIVDRLNSASLFTSVGFAQLWRTQGGREVFYVVEEEGRPLAVLPGCEFGTRPLRRFQAMPDGCYANIVDLSNSGVDRGQECRSILEAVSGGGYVRAYLVDYYGLFSGLATGEVSECRTLLVDVSDADWDPPDKKIQSEIRKAEREGITVERFIPDKHLDSFLSLMCRTEERHGRKPKYTDQFYRALGALGGNDDRVQWMYTEYDGKAAASHINLVLGDTLLNWQVFFDKDFSFLKPNQFMLLQAVKEASQKGVRYLNLGSSPMDAEGLLAYKRKWGGREHSYCRYCFESGLGKLM